MAVVSITNDNIEELLNSGRTLLIDFYADWCGPCRMVAPIVDQIAEEKTDIAVDKINIDEQPELAEKYGVMSIPTLIVIKDREVVNKGTGVQPKGKLLEWLK